MNVIRVRGPVVEILVRLIVATLFAVLLTPVLGGSTARAQAFTYTEVDAGLGRACARSIDARWFCWGSLYDGRMVGGAPRYRYAAVPEEVTLPNGRPVASVSAGADDTACAVDVDGGAWCWGLGQLGATFVTESAVPVPVEAPAGVLFTSVQASYSVACALSTARELWCWGDVLDTGSGETEPIRTPVKVLLPVGVTVDAYEIGLDTHCVAGSDALTYCWGSNDAGEAGVGHASARIGVPTPVVLPAGVRFARFSSGLDRTCAVSTVGDAYCWGDNYEGSFGDDTYNDSPIPKKMVVPGGEAVADISTGWYHTCIVTVGNNTWCFGRGGYGELGSGHTLGGKTKRAPRLPAGVRVADIDLTNGLTVAVDTQGSVWVWGNDIGTTAGLDGVEISLDPLRVVPVGTPDIGAVSVTDITPTSFVVNGSVVANGPGATISVQYSTSPTFANPNTVGVPSVGDFTATPVRVVVNGLEPRTTYYVRVIAANRSTNGTPTVGVATSAVTTGAAPTLGATSVVHIGSTSVALQTMVSAGDLATTVELEVADDPTMTRVASRTSIDIPATSHGYVMNIGVDGLVPVHGYFARVTATNRVGSVTSTVVPVTTVGEPPRVKNASFTATHHTVDATALIVSGELTTRAWLEVMTVDTAGTLQSEAFVIGTGAGDSSFTVTGVRPHAKHWARLVAENVLGRDETPWTAVVTAGGVPVVDRPVVDSITSTSAVVTAVFDTTGVASLVKLQIANNPEFTGAVDDIAVHYGAEAGTIARTVDLNRLDPHHTYFVRLVAGNEVGTATSETTSFTTPRPTGVVINNDAESTDSVDVTLAFTAPAGTVAVFVADNPDMARAHLERFAPDLAYTLAASTDAEVERSVYVRFVAADLSMSSVYGDSIRLVSASPGVSIASSVPMNAKPKVSASTKVQATSVRFNVTTKTAKTSIVAVQTKIGNKVTTLRIGSSANGVYTVQLPANRPVSYVRLVDTQGRVTAWTKVKASRLT